MGAGGGEGRERGRDKRRDSRKRVKVWGRGKGGKANKGRGKQEGREITLEKENGDTVDKKEKEKRKGGNEEGKEIKLCE